jgi:hypothetical protein
MNISAQDAQKLKLWLKSRGGVSPLPAAGDPKDLPYVHMIYPPPVLEINIQKIYYDDARLPFDVLFPESLSMDYLY